MRIFFAAGLLVLAAAGWLEWQDHQRDLAIADCWEDPGNSLLPGADYGCPSE